MKVIDVFSGRRGFSRAFTERGHDVLTIDADPSFNPDICGDVRDISLPPRFDTFLAAPPCTEFSKFGLPDSWWPEKTPPSLELVQETRRLRIESGAKWWVIENVKGAVRFLNPVLGHYTKRVGSRYLWGDFPPFYSRPKFGKWRLGPARDRAARRAEIPFEISWGLCVAMEAFA